MRACHARVGSSILPGRTKNAALRGGVRLWPGAHLFFRNESVEKTGARIETVLQIFYAHMQQNIENRHCSCKERFSLAAPQ